MGSGIGLLQGQLYTVNYSSQDGLPNDLVACMNEDQLGYIWVGTSSGLVMFDGVNFIKKGWQGEGELPKEVFIKEILFDKHQNLWVSTERNGIFHQNNASQVWTNFSTSKTDSKHITSNEIYDIELHEDKLYFSCSGGGFAYIEINDQSVKEEEVLVAIGAKKYQSDPQNKRLLLGTRNSMYSITYSSDSPVIDTLFQNFPNLEISDIHLDTEGRIWLTDYSRGIFLYNASTKDLLDKNTQNFGDGWNYKHLFTKKNHEWLLMPNTGIAEKNIKDLGWKLHTPKPFDFHSLPKASFTNIFEAKNGTIWISSSKGLSCIHPDYQGFKYIEREGDETDYLLDAKLTDNGDRYFLSYASPGNRIKIFDKNFNFLSGLNHSSDDKRMLSIFKLIPYSEGYLALSNFIYYLNTKTSKITKAHLSGLSQNISPRAAFIQEDELWIYTSENRLIQYSITQQKKLQEIYLPIFKEKPYPFYLVHEIEDFGNFVGISAESVFVLVSKSNKSIHIYDLDLNSGKMNKISTHPKNPGTITQSVYLGNGDFYLLSKGEGFYKAHLDEKSMEIQLINTLIPDQLYSPVEVAIAPDEKLWIATDNGLAIVSKELKLLKKITGIHGLKTTKLVQGLSLIEDKILLNGASGIIVGDTAVLSKKMEPVEVHLSDVQLSGIDLLRTAKTTFDHSKNTLHIKLSTPLYANRAAYKYAYRLYNHSEEWTYQDLKFDAVHYDKLPPGSYVFEVKSIVNDTEGEVTRLQFKIAPPFWETWWFLCFALLVLALFLYMLYKNRLKNKLANERLNTKLAELKNEAIRAQLNPHFIFNALNSIRSMILMDKKEESIEYLGHFSSMVRDILSLSKARNISLSKEIEFNKKYIQIEQLRFSERFSYHINVDPGIDPSKIKVPPLLLQPFIENAIWHGLLHKEGEAILKIDISQSDKMLFIQIDDNGIGIKASEKSKSSLLTKTRKGYGEMLSKQRISTLGEKAEINIHEKSKNGTSDGTLVTIKIPLMYD